MEELGVLHAFTGNIEGEVGTIDDASEETEPFGEEPFGLGVYEDFSAVKGDAAFCSVEAEFFGIFFWNVKECVDGEGGVGVKMEPEKRVIEGFGLEFVEFLIFFVFEFGFSAKPEGLDGIEFFVV